MSAFDHLLNVLDIALKAGDRNAAEREQAAAKKKAASARRIKGFGEKAPKPDPSCCLAKRNGGTES